MHNSNHVLAREYVTSITKCILPCQIVANIITCSILWTASIRADMSTQNIQRQYKNNIPRNTPLVTDPCSRYYHWISNILMTILDMGWYLLKHQSKDHIISQIWSDYILSFFFNFVKSASLKFWQIFCFQNVTRGVSSLEAGT